MRFVSSLVSILFFIIAVTLRVDACVDAPAKSGKSNHASSKVSKKTDSKKLAEKKSSNSQRRPASVKVVKDKKAKPQDKHKKKAQMIPLPQKNKKLVAISKKEPRQPSSVAHTSKGINKKKQAKSDPMKPMLSYLSSKDTAGNNSGDVLREDELDHQAIESAEASGLSIKHESPAVIVSDDGT